MAVKTKDEILTSLKSKFGDDTGDDVLNILEDVTDTLTDAETRAKGDGTDWKKKYEDNDKEWRTKYRDRFMSGELLSNEPDTDETEKPKVKTFEELFLVKE